jgi:hypothetical protein
VVILAPEPNTYKGTWTKYEKKITKQKTQVFGFGYVFKKLRDIAKSSWILFG